MIEKIFFKTRFEISLKSKILSNDVLLIIISIYYIIIIRLHDINLEYSIISLILLISIEKDYKKKILENFNIFSLLNIMKLFNMNIYDYIEIEFI